MGDVNANAWQQVRKSLRVYPNEALIRFLATRAPVQIPGLVTSASTTRETVLDVGCGLGSNTQALLEQSYNVIAVDAAKGCCEDTYDRVSRSGPWETALYLAPHSRSSNPRWATVLQRPSRPQCLVIQHTALEFLQALVEFRVFVDGVVDSECIQHVPWDDHQTFVQLASKVTLVPGWIWSSHLTAVDDTAPSEQDETYEYSTIRRFPRIGLTCLVPSTVWKGVFEKRGWSVVCETTVRTDTKGMMTQTFLQATRGGDK